jgi:hypothetical protein
MKHIKGVFQGTNWQKAKNSIRFDDGNKHPIDRNKPIASGNKHVIEESKNYPTVNGRTPTKHGTECVFRAKAATDSEAKRPLIPTESGHPIRTKAASDSDRRRPPCG